MVLDVGHSSIVTGHALDRHGQEVVRHALAGHRLGDADGGSLPFQEIDLQSQIRLHGEVHRRIGVSYPAHPIGRNDPISKLIPAGRRGGHGEAASYHERGVAVIGRERSLSIRLDVQFPVMD